MLGETDPSPVFLILIQRHEKAVYNRLVLMERGEVPLVHKAAAAQDAGALGVIVTDMGNCTAFDQFCSPGAGQLSYTPDCSICTQHRP